MKRLAGFLAASLLTCALIVLMLALPAKAEKVESVKVALVPSEEGLAGNGGTLPLSGFPGGYSPSFDSLGLATIRDAANDPIVAGGYDTVVLVQINYVQNWLSDSTFKSRITDFVFSGGKLIIWDSECEQNDYSQFIYPFTEDTPGAHGSSSGTLWIVENNTLGTNDTTSLSYLNTNSISEGYDIGDANVMVTSVPDWCTHMVGRNLNIVVGPVQTYATYGRGLIIWTGLDMDYMTDPIIANDDSGPHNLNYIWYLQLKQQWDPDPLPHNIRTMGLTVTPTSGTNPVETGHTVIATLRDNLSRPIASVTVDFTIYAGPSSGLKGSDVTNAAGEAYFSWTSAATGTDCLNATAKSPFNPALTIFDDKATKTWTGKVPPTFSYMDISPLLLAVFILGLLTAAILLLVLLMLQPPRRRKKEIDRSIAKKKKVLESKVFALESEVDRLRDEAKTLRDLLGPKEEEK